ncbi:MAG TPA: hypothetical protein VKL22_07955, partial [Actinomycetota bacterium]|nr:hypothetical protein [Actinomycetota bacterium]
MRLYRYASAATGGRPRLGAAAPGGPVVDLAEAWRPVHGAPAPDACSSGSTILLIGEGRAVWAM